jgi:hypothetical protein
MSKTAPRNLPASIRQRLLNHAQANGDDYQRVLIRYAIERLLVRISRSGARDRYILKGAMLFVTWPEQVFRPTGDLDLLGEGDPSPEAITALFTEICQLDGGDDGIVFDLATLQVEPVREEEQYQGVRLTVVGLIGTTRTRVQVDIGFGDHVHPAAKRDIFPALLADLPTATMLMYPKETVVAEKFEAMIRFGEANGRIKDFHDIWVTERTFEFDLATLTEAVRGTLRRRQTAEPAGLPMALRPAFAERRETLGLWSGFLRRSPPMMEPPPFDQLLGELRQFFEPVLGALATPGAQQGLWSPARGAWERR